MVSQARRTSSSRTLSGWKPWKVTMSPSPSSAASVVSRIRSGPSPTMSTRSFGTTGRGDRQLGQQHVDALVRDQPRDHRDRRLRVARGAHLGGRRAAVGHDVDRASEAQPAAQLLAGRRRHRDDRTVLVDDAGPLPLEKAAHGGEHRAEPHARTGPGARGGRPARPARRARRTAGRRTGCRSGSRRRSRCGRNGAAEPTPCAGRG